MPTALRLLRTPSSDNANPPSSPQIQRGSNWVETQNAKIISDLPLRIKEQISLVRLKCVCSLFLQRPRLIFRHLPSYQPAVTKVGTSAAHSSEPTGLRGASYAAVTRQDFFLRCPQIDSLLAGRGPVSLSSAFLLSSTVRDLVEQDAPAGGNTHTNTHTLI